jgi:Membrane protein involved in colicin uptake
MADITVQHLATVVGTTAEKLVEQLKDAGVKGKTISSTLSEDDKVKLLAHLRESHGKAKADITRPKKTMTLKRRKPEVTELKQTKGRGAGSVSIEVRKKKGPGRSADEIATGLSSDELLEAEKAAAAHQKLVEEQEAVREKEQERLNKQQEVKDKLEAEKQAKLEEERAAEAAKKAAEEAAAAKQAAEEAAKLAADEKEKTPEPADKESRMASPEVMARIKAEVDAKKAREAARKPDKKKGSSKFDGGILHIDKKPRRIKRRGLINPVIFVLNRVKNMVLKCLRRQLFMM